MILAENEGFSTENDFNSSTFLTNADANFRYL